MKKILKYVLLWFVALSILNASIDVNETQEVLSHTNTSGNSTEYNEIESLAELLMQETSNQSLPDQKNNSQQGLIKKSVSVDFALPEKKVKIVSDFILKSQNRVLSYQYTHTLPLGHSSLFTPPPDLLS